MSHRESYLGYVFMVSVGLFSGGCGTELATSAGGAGETVNALSAAVSTLTGKIDAAAGISDYTASLASRSSARFIRSSIRTTDNSFGSDWSQSLAGLGDPRVDGSTSISPKDFMGLQLDDSAVADDGHDINAFGRMSTAFQILCAVGVGASEAGETVDENGYLPNGSYTITFTAGVKAAMQSTCGLSPDGIPDGASMVLTVTSGGTNYDKVFGFNLFSLKYMVKNDATILRVASAEDSTYHFSRSLAEYNKSTGITRAEYVSVPKLGVSAGSEVFRLFYDSVQDEGMILGLFASNTDFNAGQRYIVAGKPGTGDALSLSFRADYALTGSHKREACVNSSTGEPVSGGDGARCVASSTRLNGAGIDDMETSLSTWFTTYVNDGASGPSNSVRDDWGKDATTDSKMISFSDMSTLVSSSVAP